MTTVDDAESRGDLVLRFLASIGKPAEAQAYLELFRAERPESFAIIAVGDSNLDPAIDALITDFRFLSELGLEPVVAFGLVSPERGRAQAEAIAARLLPVARCRVVDADGASAACREGVIPLVPGFAGARTVDARFDRLAQLAGALGGRKLVFLGRRSGLQPKGKPALSLVDLTTEYDALTGAGVLPARQAALLRQVRRLLDAVPHRMTVSVTSPLDLLRELFTVKGAGTLIRRGSTVRRHAGFAEVDRARLEELIERAFGRPLSPAFFERPALAIYIADDYRGAAVVTPTELGPYLSKFAVDVAARGEGIGRDLWQALTRDYPAFFWRSRAANPITPWYVQQCDGMLRTDPWIIFWRGLAPADLPAAITRAQSAPVDL
jgi:bifunctional N-acetylglutamate synthase/kinase